MKCPYCGSQEDKVVDSRSVRDGAAIRRRRECIECGKRYTTYEYIEQMSILVVKRDGSREKFQPFKIEDAVKKAFKSVNAEYDPAVFTLVIQKLGEQSAKSVEEVQDIIELVLFDAGLFDKFIALPVIFKIPAAI